MSLLADSLHFGHEVETLAKHAQLRTHPGTLHICLDLRSRLLKLTTVRSGYTQAARCRRSS